MILLFNAINGYNHFLSPDEQSGLRQRLQSLQRENMISILHVTFADFSPNYVVLYVAPSEFTLHEHPSCASPSRVTLVRHLYGIHRATKLTSHALEWPKLLSIAFRAR